MKKNLVMAFLLVGFLGFAQTTKKKYYKKPVKKTYAKKKVTTKQTAVVQPVVKDVIPESTNEVAKPVEIVAKVEEKQLPVDETPDYEKIAQKVLKNGGFIKNRNSDLVRGMEGFVKGVYSGNRKIFVLVEIDNRSNINYDIESAIFVTAPIKKNGRLLDTDEKTFIPIYTNQPETISRKSNQKIVYVFDKFTIADDKKLLFVMNETDGERTVTLDIKPSYIINAEFVK